MALCSAWHYCALCRPAPAQVITCADFHPQHCSIFGYSTSKGCIRLADMRAAALCDQHAKMFEDAEPAVRRGLPGGLGCSGGAHGALGAAAGCWSWSGGGSNQRPCVLGEPVVQLGEGGGCGRRRGGGRSAALVS